MEDSNPKKKISLTPSAAKIKIENYCAYQERSQQDVRDKLYEWSLHSNEVESIIANLISEDFLNEERFALTFVSGKVNIKKWGRNKIKYELKGKRVSDINIKKALNTIDDDIYRKNLSELIQKKDRLLKGKLTPVKLYKIAAFIATKGYEHELVWEVLRAYAKGE